MNDKPVGLNLIGGIAGFLSGVLMLVSSYIVVMRLQDAALGTPALKLVGVTHGLSVVSLILIVPTVIALFVLLNATTTTRSYLGLGFAMIWLVLEMVGHLSQTAPLRTLGELHADHPTHAMAIYQVSEEFAEALLDDWNLLCCAYRFMLRSLAYWWLEPAGRIHLLDRCPRIPNRDVDSPVRHSTPCCRACNRFLDCERCSD